jgi:hypothetical protein
MDAPEPVTCPLCGALVRDKPDADAADIRDLDRHFAEACPSPPTVGSRAA